MNNVHFLHYCLYLVISVGITVWVARTLFKNGQVFLNEAFQNNETLAKSVNHLLVVGFYLINIGFVALNLKTQYRVISAVESFEILGKQIGFILLVLGSMHFFNLLVLSRMRKKVKNILPKTVCKPIAQN